MGNLFNLLKKKIHTIVFVVLELIALYMFFFINDYSKSFFFNVSTAIIGKVGETRDYIYFLTKLEKINDSIANENAKLRTVLEKYREEIIPPLETENIDYIPARISYLENYTNRENFLKINKGKDQNIYNDMAVISNAGVVGIISTTTAKYAEIIPIINPKFSLSVKTKKDNYYATLTWNGEDIKKANVTEIPIFTEIKIGDTIVTSNLSSIFIEGIPVGVVSEITTEKHSSFYNIIIDLFVNYNNLTYVYVINKKKN